MKTVSAIKYFGTLAMSLVMGFALVGCDDDDDEIKPSENEFDRVECTIDVVPASDMRTFSDMAGSSVTEFSGESYPLGIHVTEKATVSFRSSDEAKFPMTANLTFAAVPKADVEMQEGKEYKLGHSIKVTTTVYSEANTILATKSENFIQSTTIDSESDYASLLKARYPKNISIKVEKSGDGYVFDVK